MKQLMVVVMMMCARAAQSEPVDGTVYKILLTQKGYAQYLQYDVETPPIREFTLCTWLKFNDLEADQTILSYVVNGGRRVLSVYMTSSGANLNILLGRAYSSIPVSLSQGAWEHVCLSYQADHGAWALYINSKPVSCEASKSLIGYVLPGHGKLLIGYGADDTGLPIGMEGEVFGVNMMLISTIERNRRSKNINIKNKQNLSKTFKDFEKDSNIKYIVLDSLNYVDKSIPPKHTTQIKTTLGSGNFMNLNADDNFHENYSEEKEILDMPVNAKMPLTLSETVWNILNSNGNRGMFKKLTRNKTELSESGTQDLPMISLYETPPPMSLSNNGNLKASMEIDQDSEQIVKMNPTLSNVMRLIKNNQHSHELLEIETPPPPDKSQPVFGQWSSTPFSGKVLNYLKSIDFMTPPKRVPSTIPLPKLSDSLPYSSNFNFIRVRKPQGFQRKIYSDKQIKIMKRNAPEINVKIIEENTRDEIIRLHALTRPVNVEVTFRGENSVNTENRRYRDVDGISSNEYNNGALSTEELLHNNKENEKANTNKMNFIVPFFNPKNFNVRDSKSFKQKINDDIVTKSLNKNNHWTNTKSLNGRRNIELEQKTANSINNLQEKLSEENQKYTGFLSNHRPDYDTDDNSNRNIINFTKMESTRNIIFDPELALQQEDSFKTTATMARRLVDDVQSETQGQQNFDKPIKIGNALNERQVIGDNEQDKQRSFLGGDEKVPDINRYRSDIDNESWQHVPPSLVPKVCRNVELAERVLYVHADGSVDKARFESLSKVKNTAVNFILNNFKNCSLDESNLDNTYLLFIDWTKTPVKLLGGAYPKKTKNVCTIF